MTVKLKKKKLIDEEMSVCPSVNAKRFGFQKNCCQFVMSTQGDGGKLHPSTLHESLSHSHNTAKVHVSSYG